MNVDVLFGGGGYLGHYLARELVNRGRVVYSLDTVNYNKVPGVINIVGGDVSKHIHMAQCTWHKNTTVTVYHLACPRNKLGEWNLEKAVCALEQGIDLANGMEADLFFASSMSVHDNPSSVYGDFKRVAEVAVNTHGGKVFRLGTLLGGEPNMPYRADLGLHIIAETIVAGKKAWVNSDIQRYVIPVWTAAYVLAEAAVRRSTGRTVADGLFKYAQIVPEGVDRRMPEKTYYTIEGTPSTTDGVVKGAFADLVICLTEGTTWPI